MTIDNKTSTRSKQTGLESFFPSLIYKGKNLPKPKKENLITILIQRRFPNSNTWICDNCTRTGDKFFMENHPCRQNIKIILQKYKDYKTKEFLAKK